MVTALVANLISVPIFGFNANNGNAPLNPIFIAANNKPRRFPSILLIQLI